MLTLSLSVVYFSSRCLCTLWELGLLFRHPRPPGRAETLMHAKRHAETEEQRWHLRLIELHIHPAPEEPLQYLPACPNYDLC